MIQTVFLDMDGVLVDFMGAVCEIIGKIPPPSVYHFFEEEREEVNRQCNMAFWINLDWMHDGHDILRAVVKRFDPKSIYLCTAPMPNTETASGKVKWIEKNIPDYLSRWIITPVPKKILANPNSLLIDDKDENIAEFCEAGGQGILVPRPWNELRGWADKSLQVVENSLENL